MDFNKIATRARAIITTPKSEWPVIAEEQTDIKTLYVSYIMVLAAIPPIFQFIKSTLIGYSMFGMQIRAGIGQGIGGIIVGWGLALIGIYVVALIINALAKTFGGEPDQVQALKVIAYASTASWLAGIGFIIPWIGWLITIVGGIYSLYLLYLGLPELMKCPPEKALGYTVVTIISAIVVYIIIGTIVGSIMSVSVTRQGAPAISGNNGQVKLNKETRAKVKKMQHDLQQLLDQNN